MQKLKKIDIHVHALRSKGIPNLQGDTFSTPEELIEIYKHIGVEKGNLLPLVKIEHSYDFGTTREVMEIVEDYPDNFTWFCSIDPRQGQNSSKTDFSYFLDYYKDRGAKGVGEFSYNLPFDDPLMENLFAYCEKCHMPITIHIGVPSGDYGVIDQIGLPGLERALQKYPDLQVLGHSQKFWSHISGDVNGNNWSGYPKGKVQPNGRVVELLQKYPNLYCDLSAGSGYNAMTRDPEFTYDFLEEFQDRIYYGTDICMARDIDNPMLKLAEFLDTAMEQGRISYTAYEKIVRGNALRLLK